MKKYLLVLFIIAFVSVAQAQTAKVDSSSLFKELMSLEKLTPQQVDDYFTAKKFAISSRMTKKVSDYDTDFIDYKVPDKPDRYSFVVVKNKMVEALYITYDKNIYQQAVDLAEKAGFKVKEPATVTSSQIVYAKKHLRFSADSSITKSGKIFYTMGVSDLLTTVKVLADAKKN